MKTALLILFGLITLYFVVQLVREYTYNKLLLNKQKGMRVPQAHVPKPSKVSWIKALVPAAGLAIAFTLNPSIQYTPTLNGLEIAQIESEADLKAIWEEYNQSALTKNFVTTDMAVQEEAAFDSTSAIAPSVGSDADRNTSSLLENGSTDYTETNVQVVGVDEIDNVKTDGTFIYSVRYDYNTYQNEVVVSLAYPPSSMEIYKRFTFESSNDCWNYDKESTEVPPLCVNEYPQGIYVDEDHLIIIVSRDTWQPYIYEGDYEIAVDGVMPTEDAAVPSDGSTDASTEKTSTVESTKLVSPYYFDANQQTVVYVLDKHNDFALVDEYAFEGYMMGTRRIGDDLFLITNSWLNTEDETLIPTYSINGDIITPEYDTVTYLKDTNPYAFTTIYGIDLTTTNVDVNNILGGSSSTIYVSNNNIYTIDHRWYIQPLIRTFAAETDPSDPDTYEDITIISRYALDGNDVTFAAAGEVKGYPLNQFSMDEKDSNLRITTTTGWGEYTNNRLIVLNSELTILSELQNLGKPNERLQSTRFVGDLAYLVTFEQTDPFYVIDLSVPTSPVILGELEITGFSSYMQPIDANHILGIGFEADENGRTIGLKLAIFDVTDPTNPLEISKEVMLYEEQGWSYTGAVYNHKDLLLDVNRQIIGFPFQTEVYENNQYNWQAGYMVYSFEDLNLTEEAFITHGVSPEGRWYYDYMQKGLFMDDYLYTVANNAIGVSELSDLSTLLNLLELQ